MYLKHAAAQINGPQMWAKNNNYNSQNKNVQPSDINLPTVDGPKTPPTGTPIYLLTISASKIPPGTPINLPPNISPNVYLMYMQ